MAVGRPVVLVGPQRSDVGAAIERYRCGRIVEQGDVAGLTAAVSTLAEDDSLRREYGSASLEGFRQEYSSEIVLKRIQRAVGDLVG
jgi:glycosyltransferase involved in cell wall biosynthesis